MRRRRFVILDRDGTLIVERHYLSDPKQVMLLPGAAEGLRQLRRLGLGLVVVTNQSAIARGLIDAARLNAIHRRVRRLLRSAGIILDGLYWCPHHPDDGCHCRKPGVGLVQQAARELGFDPRRSFVVGDKPCDIDLGQRLGATTLLVRTGYGAQVASEQAVMVDFIVDDLQEAARVIENLLTARTAQRVA
jgi:D-glycero-D-manno-heptose 1,7-bisphosphate phosphatase